MWLTVLVLVVGWEAGLVTGLRFGGGIHLLLVAAALGTMADAWRSRRHAVVLPIAGSWRGSPAPREAA